MKKEIEVKILNIDKASIGKTLKKLGAIKILKPTLMRELYWESSAKKRLYSSFRLRSEGNDNFLTIKLKKEDNNFEIRDEFEVAVGDFGKTKKILELAGFKVFRQREKVREEYKLGKTKIEIDQYPNMNPYLEIEGSSKKEVEKFLKKLGFSLKYTTNRTATEVIRDAGLDPNFLFFKK